MSHNQLPPLRDELIQAVTNIPPFYEKTKTALHHCPKHSGMRIFTFEDDSTIYIDAVCPYTKEYISLLPGLIEAQKGIPTDGIIRPFPWDEADIVMLYHGKGRMIPSVGMPFCASIRPGSKEIYSLV